MAKQNAATKAGKAVTILSVAERVALTLESFADFLTASGTLDEAQALWTMARLACREEIKAAFAQYAKGKDWALYLKGTRDGLVARKIVGTTKAARTLVDNQLIALKITGNTDRAGKGGKRKGAGRPEVTETGEVTNVSEKATAARLVAVLAYVAQQQANPTDDADVILGNVAKLCNGIKL